MKKVRIDLKGKKFGELTVLEYAFTKNNAAYWLCQCNCGNKKIILANSLLQNKTNSCGCLRKKLLLKHNKSKSNIYQTWMNMKQRCYNVKSTNYKWYGAKGIIVCEEWINDFENFYNWALNNGYKNNLKRGECTLDRINVNGNYEPNNCRWITNKEQANNKTTNHFLTYNNVTHTIAEWAEIIGIRKNTLHTRINRGWSIDRALNKKGE